MLCPAYLKLVHTTDAVCLVYIMYSVNLLLLQYADVAAGDVVVDDHQQLIVLYRQ